MSSIGNNYTPFYVTDADLEKSLLDRVTALAVMSNRNRLINGRMAIDQRFAGSVTSSAGYCVDRWAVAQASGSMTAQRVGVEGAYSVSLTATSSVTGLNFYQRVEAANIADLAGKTVTLSFVASSPTITSLPWSVSHAGGLDSFASVTQIASGNVTITSSPTRYFVRVTLPSGAANGVQVNLASQMTMPNGSVLSFTDVQLELGSLATPMEYRPYGLELSLCQRYYSKSYNVNAVPGSLTFIGAAGGIARQWRPQAFFPVTMRVPPSMTLYNPQTGIAGTIYNNNSPATVNIAEIGQSSFCLSGPVVVGSDNDIRWHWVANSEL